MKNPIKWVEVPVDDMDRAEKFYTEYLGLNMSRQPDKGDVQTSWFEMAEDEYGAAGMLIKHPQYTPSHEGVSVYFAAPQGTVESSLEKAEEMGIKIVVPRMDIGEHGFFAAIEDSEGNRIALHSMEG